MARITLLLTTVISILAIFFSYGCKSSSNAPVDSPETWRVFTTANSRLTNNFINDITIASDRRVWLSTLNGACGFYNGTWSIIKDSLKSTNPAYNPDYAPVFSIVEAKDRSLWFCLPGGVVRFNQQSTIKVWSRYLTGYTVLAGAADRSNQTVYGEMWFACGNLGIQRFEQTVYENQTTYSYTMGDGSTPLPSQVVLSAAIKPDDYTVWFGTETGGMVSGYFSQMGALTWMRYTPPAADQRINAIAFDLSNNVWCARDTDVAVYNTHQGNWIQYSHGKTNGQMPHAVVLSILTNYDKLRWFGTDSGLVELNDTVWTRFTTANSPIPNDSITALRYDAQSNLWIGTPAGAVIYNPKGIRYQ